MSLLRRTLVALGRARRAKPSPDRRAIEASGLFDPVWYLARYPDVAGYGGGALEHFLLHGTREGRSPGPDFDTWAYLAANPDVARSGVDPLLHYIRGGAAEGRRFAPVRKPFVPVAARPAAEAGFSLLLRPGPAVGLRATLDSLHRQGAARVEVIALGDDAALRRGIAALGSAGASAAGSLREAVALAREDFIVMLDAGDVLAEGALPALARHIGAGEPDVVYGDEINAGGERVLKPGWSPELLGATNYLGRLTAIRRDLAARSVPDPERGVATEWALNLSVTAAASRIEHLPRALCRRAPGAADRERVLAGAGADYADALADHWRRQGVTPAVRPRPDGTFATAWPADGAPLVSIIVEARGEAPGLRSCLARLPDGPAREVIVVRHGAVAATPDDLPVGARCVRVGGEYNRARLRNRGAREARGAVLMFLDDDVAGADPAWLAHLVVAAMRPGVGVVGPMILRPDGAVAQAGIAFGLSTLDTPMFQGAAEGAWGPFGSAGTPRNWSAVGGACQAVRRAVFDLVGGCDEGFTGTAGDLALCLDAGRMGFRSLCLPAARMVRPDRPPRPGECSPEDERRLARRLRALGMETDPYAHPALDPASTVPRVSHAETDRGLAAAIERLAGPPPAGSPDLFDDGAVAAAAGLPWSAIAWRFDPATLRPDTGHAARIVIEFVRRRPNLRARFPRALSEGAHGGFASWVMSEGLACLGLGPEYRPAIEAAFAAALGARARQRLLLELAAGADGPFLLLPEGRAAACRHLFGSLGADGLTLEGVWWCLIAGAEDPVGELCATWAALPEWQAAVPDGGTAFGIDRLVDWIVETHGVAGPWLFEPGAPALMPPAQQVRLAADANGWWADRPADMEAARTLLDRLAGRASGLPFRARAFVEAQDRDALAREIAAPGVNVLAHLAYPSGLRISAESMVEGLRRSGVATSLRDVPVAGPDDEPVGQSCQGCEVYGTTILHVQPEPYFAGVYDRAGLRPRMPRTYRVGYWYHEFDTVPASWNRAALACDELWTATEFIATGLRARFPQPVHVLPPGIEIGPFARASRRDLGLPEDRYLFLFAFHMMSIMERKNPFGLIEAFGEAFGRAGEGGAGLVIKTAFGRYHPDQLAELERRAEAVGARVIDASASRDETLSLIAACDAYVSLHRSEGLGLSMAEAMLLGKPVIATRYSGNLAFMDEHNSLLVDCEVVALGRDVPPYEAGSRWAEPSTAHAAACMRRLYNDRGFGEALGARAKADLERRLSYAEAGRRMAARLAEIAAMP